MTALEARELYRFFHTGEEEVKALRGVDLKGEEGESIAIVGPSGSGKSTLLACLAGLQEPDGGEVEVMGQRMTRREERDKTALRLRTMGIMTQKENLFAHLTVAQNVRLAQRVGGADDELRTTSFLAKIGMRSRMDAIPAQLSGGERARAALAVALARKPAILILDEPTGEVDAETEHVILGVLKEHCRDGGTIVVATHNPAVTRHADRVLAMKDGRIVGG